MKKITLLVILMFAFVTLMSCAGTETALERNRGRALETAKFNQTVNPGRINLDSIEGTSGLAADAVMKNYNDSFRQQKRQEIVNIIHLR